MTWVTDVLRHIKCADCGVKVETRSRTKKRCVTCQDKREYIMRKSRDARSTQKPLQTVQQRATETDTRHAS